MANLLTFTTYIYAMSYVNSKPEQAKKLENLQIKYTRCYRSVFTCKPLNTCSFYCASLKCLQVDSYLYELT